MRGKQNKKTTQLQTYNIFRREGRVIQKAEPEDQRSTGNYCWEGVGLSPNQGTSNISLTRISIVIVLPISSFVNRTV